MPSLERSYRLEGEGLCPICSASFTYHGSRKSIWEGTSEHDFVNQYQETDQYPNLPKLEARAKAGCKFCGYIRSVILENTRFWLGRIVQPEDRCEIDLNWPKITLEIPNQNTSDQLNFNGAAVTGSCSLTIKGFPENITRLLPRVIALGYIRLSVLINQGKQISGNIKQYLTIKRLRRISC